MTTRRAFFALFVTKFSYRALLLGALSLSGLLQPAFSQQTLGSMNGTVTDSSGAVVQGVSVKARATATNLEVTATSKGDGSFSIADLAARVRHVPQRIVILPPSFHHAYFQGKVGKPSIADDAHQGRRHLPPYDDPLRGGPRIQCPGT